MTRKILPIFACLVFIFQACGAGAKPTNIPLDATSQPAINETLIVNETPTTAITEPLNPQPDFSPILLKAGYGFRSNWIDLYFTDPTSSYATSEAGGVDGILSAAIVSAHESVDIAINSLSLPILTHALIRAKDRNVNVRIVMESDYLDANRPNPQALIDAGIPIVGDHEKEGMDNNFIVVDNRQVWTGSMTFTAAGVYHGYNNLININSEEIAQNYTREFEEMFINYQFGPNIVPDTPNPTVTIEGTQVESMFLPDDLFAARLTELLGNAQKSIVFTALSFTSEEFGDLIRNKAGEGINVMGVIDDFELNPTQVSQYELFKQAGLDVRLGSPDIVLFSNVIVIDSEIVILGTYDFSKKAELTIDGNVLIFHNKAIAEKFMDEFQKIQLTAGK